MAFCAYPGHRITTNDSNLIIMAILFSFILLMGLILPSSCMFKCEVKMLSNLEYTFSKTCMPCLIPQHRGQWSAHKYSTKVCSNNNLMLTFKNLKCFFSELDWCYKKKYFKVTTRKSFMSILRKVLYFHIFNFILTCVSLLFHLGMKEKSP